MKAITKLIDGIFGEDAQVRANIEEFKSTKRFKKAINVECASLATGNIDNYKNLLNAVTIVVDTKKKQIEEVLSDEQLAADLIKPLPLTDGASSSEKEIHKTEWDIYNLKERYILLNIKNEVNNELIQGDKKLLVNLLKPIITAQVRSKGDNLIVNSIMKSTGKAYKTDNLSIAMIVINTIADLGIFSLHRIKTQEGHFEIVLDFTDDRKSLKDMYLETDGRFPSLFVAKVSKSIVKRTKASYEQDIVGLNDVVDYLQSIPLAKRSDISVEDAARGTTDYEIKDEDGMSVIDAPWKSRLLDINEKVFETIDTFGKFYDKYGTDGVGRLYSESRVSIQHKSTEHFLEFAEKKALNKIGKKYIKLLIIDKMKYTIDGVKPTEEEALAYFEANEEIIKSLHPDLYSMLTSRKKTGFILEVDAQTQGPSIYGMTSLSLPLLTMTGLVGNTFRTDFYLALAKMLNNLLGTDVFNRNNVKSAFMTAGYGAGFKTIMFGNGEFDFETGDYTTASKSKKQIPLMTTAEKAGITDTKSVWKAFKKSMNTLAPDMVEIQSRLEKLAADHTHTNTLTWIMPDGVECSIIDTQTIEDHVTWLDNSGNKHSVLHGHSVANNSNVKSAAPRFIQAIDAYLLRLVIRYMESKGLQIMVNHDGFYVHPNDVEEVMFAYRLAVTDVMKRDLLTDIASQAFGKKVKSFQLSNSNLEMRLKDIRSSKYALWV